MDEKISQQISRDLSKIGERLARLEANQTNTRDVFNTFVNASNKNQGEISGLKVHIKYLTIFFGVLLTGVVSFFYTYVAKS